uniref:Flavin reductase n=1 Tax=uncultured Thiotrichaceae bacterium TaxID=298394 RepID=A0A6S6U1Y4_9GAMM|nr:MAG: Flavin reductase [uncultured Thiotrichaceae bacterium]
MSRGLRDALGCFATGVAIVTTRDGEQDIGMTCSTFNSVSLDPPLVLWNLQRHVESAPAFLNSEGYTVSVLSAKQTDLAMHFSKGTQQQRFAEIDASYAPSGRVIIPGCVAWFDCSLHQAVSAGDHEIMLGGVEDFEHFSGEGLIFERSRFGVLQAAA